MAEPTSNSKTNSNPLKTDDASALKTSDKPDESKASVAPSSSADSGKSETAKDNANPDQAPSSVDKPEDSPDSPSDTPAQTDKPDQPQSQSDANSQAKAEEKQDKPSKTQPQSEAKPDSPPQESDHQSEAKSETKPEAEAKSEPKPKTDAPKLSAQEKKQLKLEKQNTDPEVMELVEDLKEIAHDFKQFNQELEVEQDQLNQKAQSAGVVLRPDSSNSDPENSTAQANSSTPADSTPKPEVKSETASPTPPTDEDGSQTSTTDQKPDEIKPEPKKSFFKKLFSKKAKPDPQAAPESDTTKPKSKKIVKILIILAIILLPIIVFSSVTAVLANSTYQKAQKTMALARQTTDSLKSQNLPEAELKLETLKQSLLETQSAYQKITYLKIFPYIGKFVEDGTYGLNAAISGVEAGQILLETINPYADLFGLKGEGSFEGGTTEERIALILSKMGEITPNLDQVVQKLDQIQTDLDQINPDDYPETFRGIVIRPQLIEAKKTFAHGTKLLSDAQPMLNVLPQIFGYPESRKYMIMFQNDGEIRSTGGFMSAYSLVNVEQGKVNPETSNDIYHLDSQFRQIIEPPDYIKTHLNEKRLYLRNMNVSPDFMVSMDLFYQNYSTLASAESLDGIIAIDTHVLEKILEVIGPVEVPGYGTFTTEWDNRCNLTQVVCELEHIIDIPLATLVGDRKAAILGPMMKAILDKTFQGSNEQLGKLVPLMIDLLEQKHVLAYFTDETIQQASEAFNIAGRIVDFEGDYLHINDSNLGGAKSNFYIDQEVLQKIEIADDGTIKKTVEITYIHTQPADNCNLEAGQLCLSGIQRNYFRVYVPDGSILENGLGSQVEIRTGQELGKTYFDGFFELRPVSQAKVQLTYTLPFKSQPDHYPLLTQKQPGTRDIKHTVEISSAAPQEFILNQDTKLNIPL